MYRRLYYLLSDTGHAAQLGEELEKHQVPSEHIHAMIRQGEHIKNIDDVHYTGEADVGSSLEWWVWRINLVIFFAALAVLLMMLAWQPSLWMLIPLAVMASTFIAGLIFVLRVPNVHLDEFDAAVQHGEVLMMIDVPVSQLKEVNNRIHHQHVEAVSGGVCWQA